MKSLKGIVGSTSHEAKAYLDVKDKAVNHAGQGQNKAKKAYSSAFLSHIPEYIYGAGSGVCLRPKAVWPHIDN